MIFQANTKDGVSFTIESERWYEARHVARRFGAEDVLEAPGLETKPDLVLEWHGSDATVSCSRRLVIHGEDELRKKLEAPHERSRPTTNGGGMR